MAVGEAELARGQPAGALGGDDEGPDQDLAPVAAVGARVHPDAAARRAWDRARELEASEPGGARAVEADGVRRPAPGEEELTVGSGLGELALEPEHERLDAFVGDEQVGAEPDGRHREAALGRPRERLLELGKAPRPGEGERRTAGADRGEARERDSLLDPHVERLQEQRHGAVDVSGARDQHEIARPGPARDDARRVLELRRPADPHPRPCLRERVDHRAAAHGRLLARRVHLGDARGVGGRQRSAELAGEVARPGGKVRLEEDEHPLRAELARGGDRRGELGRVVRVVVVDPNASGLARELEPARRAAEAAERLGGLGPRDTGELERGERGGGVDPVVGARDGQRELHRLELPAAHDVRHLRRPAAEQLLDLGLGREGRVVVELDVGDDGDLRPELLDRAVGLVALDDEPALPGPRVAAELRQLRAQEHRRVATGLGERERDHPGRRRLPVRAGDHDRRAQRDELREQLRAPLPGKRRIRARDDHLPAVGRLGLGRDRDRDPGLAHVGRGTASRCGPSRRPRRPRRGRAARRQRARRRRSRRTRAGGPQASARSSSAISSAASGLAARSIAAPISASRAGSSSSERTSAGTRESSDSGTTTEPPPAAK